MPFPSKAVSCEQSVEVKMIYRPPDELYPKVLRVGVREINSGPRTPRCVVQLRNDQ